jgi:hypothetical protein
MQDNYKQIMLCKYKPIVSRRLRSIAKVTRSSGIHQALLSASLWNLGERIARAAATFGIADEDAAFDERQDVAERGVVGTFPTHIMRRIRPLFTA